MSNDLGWNGLGGFDNDISGVVKLASGEIISPISYLDLVLPAGYPEFRLSWRNRKYSIEDSMAFAFSKDGGVTFLNDIINFDSYVNILNAAIFDPIGSFATGFFPTTYLDSVMGTPGGLYIHPSALEGNGCDLVILPGSGDHLPMIAAPWEFARGKWNAVNAEAFVMSFSVAFPNVDATIAPTIGRQNLLRCLPYGNEDVNPPTSGETITGGSYTLWGVLP